MSQMTLKAGIERVIQEAVNRALKGLNPLIFHKPNQYELGLSREKNTLQSTRPSVIPKQHGAWAVLISCFVLGMAIGGNLGVETVLLLVSVIAGFLAQHTADLYLRLFKKTDRLRKKVLAWGIGYSSVFISAGALLIIWYDLWFLLLLGFLALFFITTTLILRQKRKAFTTAGELVEMIGLSLVAPVAEYSTTGVFSTQTVGLWVICTFFFGGSVFHVRYLVRKHTETSGPLLVRFSAGLPSIVYHLIVFAASVGLSTIMGILPSFAPIALLPVTFKALWTVGRRYEAALPIRRIGYFELTHTLIFVFLAVLAFQMPVRAT